MNDHIKFKLGMWITLEERKNPTDIELDPSKVKVISINKNLLVRKITLE